jgi:pilus assembly protein CpaB
VWTTRTRVLHDRLVSARVPTSSRATLASLAPTYRRAFLRHRRTAAALLAGAAVLMALRVVAPDPPPSALAVVAAHDLQAGTRLTSDDVREVRVARSLMPTSGALEESGAVGRVLAAPLRAGEVVTDQSVVGQSLLTGYASGTVATAIRLPDADIAALLRTGDHIDVYAAVAEIGEPASLVAADLAVIAVPRSVADTRQLGAVVLLAATPDQAARLAGASAAGALAVAIRG